MEHKHPIIKGGTNDYENLAIACLTCNLKKSSKTYEQFMKEREVTTMGDKVMHPTNQQRSAGAGVKQVKSSIIEGPTGTAQNAVPYNRSGSNNGNSGKGKKY